MNYALAMAMGLAATCATAHAQINALLPGQMTGPLATAERESLLESGLSFDGLTLTELAGNASNPLFKLGIEPHSRVVGLDWSLAVTATNPMKLSDLRIAVYSIDGTGTPARGVLLGPGDGINFSGSTRLDDERLGYSGQDGVVDLTALGLEFDASADDTVYVELFSVYAGDSITINAGSTFRILTDNVPAPGSVALVGLVGLVASRRRRG
ncbi:MAG: MYXO-CTERM domain-containing protein [Phycisphaerales bacterium]|jgi:MYXO-CTERM domain-containing protein